MDGSEHDHRPWKRIRLEDTYGSGSIDSSSFQSNEDCDHGVYIEAPLINTIVSTSEKYSHLTADYQFGQCPGPYHQTTTTSRSNTSLWPLTFSPAAGISLEGNNELSIKNSMNQVCFGMVGLHYWSNPFGIGLAKCY